MNIKTWHPDMTDAEAKDLAYWERNMIALKYADGWYYDDLPLNQHPNGWTSALMPRYKGWRRVLSLDGGKITFHVPGQL